MVVLRPSTLNLPFRMPDSSAFRSAPAPPRKYNLVWQKVLGLSTWTDLGEELFGRSCFLRPLIVFNFDLAFVPEREPLLRFISRICAILRMQSEITTEVGLNLTIADLWINPRLPLASSITLSRGLWAGDSRIWTPQQLGKIRTSRPSRPQFQTFLSVYLIG